MAGSNKGKKHRLEDFLSTVSLPIKPQGTYPEMFKAILTRKNVGAVTKAMYNERCADTIIMEDVGALHAIGVIAKNNSSRKHFYAKIIWESGLREALALELNKLCTGRNIPYLLSESIIFTDGVKGMCLDSDDMAKNIRLEQDVGCFRKAVENYAFQYGMLEEFSRVIGLDDRRGDNIIVRENGEYWNIDFGQAFMHDSSKGLRGLTKSNMPLPAQKHMPLAKKGAEEARRITRENISANISRISAMLNSICAEDYDKMKSGYSFSELQHPKDVLLNYAKRNGWDEIVRRLK